MKNTAYIYVALTVFLWSSVAAIGKMLLKDLDSFQVLFYVLVTATIGLFAILLINKKLKELSKYKLRDYWNFAYMGFLGIFLYNVLFFAALMYAPAQEAFIVNYTWPIWVVIFASLILKDKFTFKKLIAIVLGFAGVYTVVTNGNILSFTISNVKGNLLALAGAISYGLFSVLGKKQDYDKTASMFLYHLFGLLFSIPAILIFSNIPSVSMQQLAGLTWVGTFTTGIAFTFWFLALKHGDTAKMSNIIFLTPFLSLVWIYFLIGEKILLSSIIGLLIIVIGIIIQSGKDNPTPTTNRSSDKNLKQNTNFFNRWAKSYDFPIFKFWMTRFHIPIFKEISFSKDTKILDMSCGTGELLKELKGKADLTGADISEEMLKKARAKLPKEIRLQRADVHDLPFKDSTFDYTITTEAFHHYHNQPKALSELKRVTKHNGKVIVVDVNFFLRLVHWLFEKLEPGCAKVNSRKEMLQLFQKAGLRNIKQRRNFVFAVMTSGEK